MLPVVAQWITHPYVKGAVTGVGIVSVAAALVEIGYMVSRRPAASSERGV